MATAIPPEVAEILQSSTIEGPLLKLPEGKLDRDLYVKVANVLKALGGKWNAKPEENDDGPRTPPVTRPDHAARLLLSHMSALESLSHDDHDMLCQLPPRRRSSCCRVGGPPNMQPNAGDDLLCFLQPQQRSSCCRRGTRCWAPPRGASTTWR